MKKALFILFALASLLFGCGQSQEEKDMTDVVYKRYKSDAIDTGTSVPFNILNLEVKDKRKSGDSIYYDVEFVIQEMHPSRRYYYDGYSTVFYHRGEYKIKHFGYHSSRMNK